MIRKTLKPERQALVCGVVTVFFKAWFRALLATVVILSAAEGSVMLCLHATGGIHSMDVSTDEVRAFVSDCSHVDHECDTPHDVACLDLQVDGLDLNFVLDPVKLKFFGSLVATASDAGQDRLPLRGGMMSVLAPSSGPPGWSPHVHVSVSTTVLLI